jgi:hypothetical protein
MAKQNRALAETRTRFATEPSMARREPRPLKASLQGAEAKIREELFRFRTCCADPRASK